MDRGEIHNWLRRLIRTLRAEHLAMAFVAGAGGVVVTLTTTTIGTFILVNVIGQIFAIGRGWFDWQSDFPPTMRNISMVVAALLLLQAIGLRRRDTEYIFRVSSVDWKASENIGRLLEFLWAVLLDMLHSGPRMIGHARQHMGQRRALAEFDLEVGGNVLNLLHCSDHRVSFAEIVELVPDFVPETHVPQLLQLRGILHLPSEPPGLSLSTDLRKSLGAPTQAERRAARRPSLQPEPPEAAAEPEPEPMAEEVPADEPPSFGPKEAKSPAFRCAGCRRKFRLRNLQGGVTFSCPRCGEFYRTLADSQGRVRIERQSEDYDPTADLSITEDGAQAYFVLGLHPAATRQEVKTAYRKLMKEHHPDKAAGFSPVQKKLMEERAREINRAYGEIMDRLGG